MDGSNGPRAQSGLAGERNNSTVNGMYPATSVQNNYSTATRQPIPWDAVHTQHRPLQGQIQFVGQQQIISINGELYTLPIRNHHGATAIVPYPPGNPQFARQGQAGAQSGPVNPQIINNNGGNPELSIANDTHALKPVAQLVPMMGQQSRQFQRTQNYQTTAQHQYGQTHQLGNGYQRSASYQKLQNNPNHQQAAGYHTPPSNQNRATNYVIRKNSSVGNTPGVNQTHLPTSSIPRPAGHFHQTGPGFHPQAAITPQVAAPPQATAAPQAVAPFQAPPTPQAPMTPQATATPQSAAITQAGTPHNAGPPGAGVAEALQPLSSSEGTDGFQEHVKMLLKEKTTAFKGYIRNHNDFVRYEEAVRKAKLRDGNSENKAADYPQDEAGQLQIIQRIYDAILTFDGEQDPATDSGDFATCLAVKILQALSPIDVELIAHKFMVSIFPTYLFVNY